MLVGGRYDGVSLQALEPVLEQSGALGVLVQCDVALTEDPEQGVVQPPYGARRVSVVHPRGDGGLVGQLPAGARTPEQLGMVLAKGSPMTACVSQAVDVLKSDGTLSKLESEWLSGTDGAAKLS